MNVSACLCSVLEGFDGIHASVQRRRSVPLFFGHAESSLEELVCFRLHAHGMRSHRARREHVNLSGDPASVRDSSRRDIVIRSTEVLGPQLDLLVFKGLVKGVMHPYGFETGCAREVTTLVCDFGAADHDVVDIIEHALVQLDASTGSARDTSGVLLGKARRGGLRLCERRVGVEVNGVGEVKHFKKHGQAGRALKFSRSAAQTEYLLEASEVHGCFFRALRHLLTLY